jgi:hypothetical protein
LAWVFLWERCGATRRADGMVNAVMLVPGERRGISVIPDQESG